MYKIEMMEFPSEDIIQKSIQMDHAAFQATEWITEERAHSIYHNKKDCLIWLTQKDEPIGFITIFPLNQNIPIRAMEMNQPIYKLLSQESLSDPNTNILYWHCLLLLPGFRGNGLKYKLYEGLRMWLEQKGTEYTSLYADAVSPEGQCCLEELGFVPIHSFGKEGLLYRAEKEDVLDLESSIRSKNRDRKKVT